MEPLNILFRTNSHVRFDEWENRDWRFESISPTPPSLLDAWIVESESRLDAFQRGEIEAIDGQEALKALRNSLSK